MTTFDMFSAIISAPMSRFDSRLEIERQGARAFSVGLRATDCPYTGQPHQSHRCENRQREQAYSFDPAKAWLTGTPAQRRTPTPPTWLRVSPRACGATRKASNNLLPETRDHR
jgi:hypothetical protein